MERRVRFSALRKAQSIRSDDRSRLAMKFEADGQDSKVQVMGCIVGKAEPAKVMRAVAEAEAISRNGGRGPVSRWWPDVNPPLKCLYNDSEPEENKAKSLGRRDEASYRASQASLLFFVDTMSQVTQISTNHRRSNPPGRFDGAAFLSLLTMASPRLVIERQRA
ncbi:uncharacterized protein UHOD_12803 [Ustilago sp. UG-2017b]|nr:uncharacterized protein UHOD_12803 [Ustilago sp. UG-2017b]